jgi:hypothetical protein
MGEKRVSELWYIERDLRVILSQDSVISFRNGYFAQGPWWRRSVEVRRMAEIVKLAKFRRSRTKAIEGKSKPKKFQKRQKGHKWPSFKTATRAMPLATELTKSRETTPPVPQGHSIILESGVLAFRRESNGEPLILLISKRRSKKWGIPKGRVVPHLSFHENAAKEAFEEAV